jgi:hypothetical protein
MLGTRKSFIYHFTVFRRGGLMLPLSLRPTLNWVFGTAAALAAGYTFYLVWARLGTIPKDPNIREALTACEKFLVAFWIVGPPVYIWAEWVLFAGNMTKDDRETAKHTHDLARNIWLAVAAVILYAFFGKAGLG